MSHICASAHLAGKQNECTTCAHTAQQVRVPFGIAGDLLTEILELGEMLNKDMKDSNAKKY